MNRSKGLLFYLLRTSNHPLKCHIPLLLSSAYHQVEIGTFGKDSLTIKNFNRKHLDIWINGRSLLKFTDEYRNRENGDIAVRLEQNKEEENITNLIFCVSARYEINVSNISNKRNNIDSILGDKRRPSVMVAMPPPPYIKIIVDAV